jgi:16S rRNA C967 or C1407 C5-methylase (RsmB/RsmF family)
MNERARQWLRWVGKLYQIIVESEKPADAVLSGRMRGEGRRWGHDARRWVASAVYALVRSRPRTLWFWAAGVRESPHIREALLRRSDKGRGSTAQPVISKPDSGSESIPRGVLSARHAAELRIIPRRYGDPVKELDEGVLPLLSEAAVGWVARRPGSPLDQLARAFEEWISPAKSMEVLRMLSEGAECAPDDRLADALLGWSRQCAETPPVDGSPTESLGWTYSIPMWLAGRWCEVFGQEETSRLAEVFENPAPIYLRVNTFKATAPEVIRRLQKENYYITDTEEVPGALLVVHRANLYRSRSFSEGLFEVQDLSSQAVSLALDPKPGERVLDYCAGAGGKTLHLASLMENKGLLWALDIDARRLVRMRVRAARAGAFNIRRGLLEPFPAEVLAEVESSASHPKIEETRIPYAAAHAPGSADEPESSDAVAPEPSSSGVPEPMRHALGLEVPDPEESPEDMDFEAAGSPKRDRRAAELPEPSEQEKSRLREALRTLLREFDAVLVDAPCSGTGVYRRRPDFGWRVTPEHVQEQMREQAAILRAAARYVRPGGRLLYATCSILPEENENQILSFLRDHPDFEPGDLGDPLGRHGLGHWITGTETHWLTLLPSRRPGDGFFMALLRRKADSTESSESQDA